MARKQAQPHMTDEDRRFVYRTLKKKFDFDEEYPLASLGWCFVREGIDREDYGFLKLKPMLEEMSDFVSMSTKEIGGVSQSMFSLREFEPYESEVPHDGGAPRDEAPTEEGDEPASSNRMNDVNLSSGNEGSETLQKSFNKQTSKKKLTDKKEADDVSAGYAEASGKRGEGADAVEADGASVVDDASDNANNRKSTFQKNAVSKKKQSAKKKQEELKESNSEKDTNNDEKGGRRRSLAESEHAAEPDRVDDGFVADCAHAEEDSAFSGDAVVESDSSASGDRLTRAKAASGGRASREAASKDVSAHCADRTDVAENGAASDAKPAKACVRRSAKSGSSAASKATTASKIDGVAAVDGASDGKARRKAASDSDASARRRSKGSASGKDQPPARIDRRPRRRVIPGKALERFGYLGTWQEFLETLAGLALDEPWDFNDAGLDVRTRRFDILHNYIRYTFYRLTLEDKVGFSADEDFAAWNTGLVDRHYEDIYACFEPSDPDNPEQARYSWTFSGFCTAGTGRLGKRLVRELNPLPQPASYLERKEDLLFDLDREVVCDVHHIVVDNVHRLPVNFLRDELASSQECLGILAGVEELSDGARGERFEKLRGVIENDTRLFNRLSTSINAAIDVAKRQVRWNYKTAVPAYYPRTNSMNLLLPLILTDSPTPDVALVVELQKSGNYQGQTIVTMAQAYRDARLLCRPYIDWLSPASIIDAAEEEDEEE